MFKKNLSLCLLATLVLPVLARPAPSPGTDKESFQWQLGEAQKRSASPNYDLLKLVSVADFEQKEVQFKDDYFSTGAAPGNLVYRLPKGLSGSAIKLTFSGLLEKGAVNVYVANSEGTPQAELNLHGSALSRSGEKVFVVADESWYLVIELPPLSLLKLTMVKLSKRTR